MDNANFQNPAVPNFDRPIPPDDDLNKPIPLDDLDKPLPLDSGATSKAKISHAPLNLGGPPAAAPAAKIQIRQTVANKPVPKAVSSSSDRITGMKTFFTKLHGGAILFLEEQIGKWLAQNPAVVIKRTNITTGDVQGKKTEPNLIITVWY